MKEQAINLLDCPINPLNMDEALTWCLNACRGEEPAKIVVTANASHLVEMQRNSELRSACYSADLVVADGMSIVWAAKLLGHRLPQRVAGIDLLSQLLNIGQDHRVRMYFLGARPHVIERFISTTREKYPRLVIAGFRNGYFSSSEHEHVVEDIRASQADILVVGMPSPFKDTWCQHYRNEFGVKLIIGVGGSFDVLSGMIRRAPKWLQKLGLEWSWRLLLEPRRLWRRYLVGNSRFLLLTLSWSLAVLEGARGSDVDPESGL